MQIGAPGADSIQSTDQIVSDGNALEIYRKFALALKFLEAFCLKLFDVEVDGLLKNENYKVFLLYTPNLTLRFGIKYLKHNERIVAGP